LTIKQGEITEGWHKYDLLENDEVVWAGLVEETTRLKGC